MSTRTRKVSGGHSTTSGQTWKTPDSSNVKKSLAKEDVHGTSEKIESILGKHDYPLLHEFHRYLTLQLDNPGREHHFRFLNNLKRITVLVLAVNNTFINMLLYEYVVR